MENALQWKRGTYATLPTVRPFPSSEQAMADKWQESNPTSQKEASHGRKIIAGTNAGGCPASAEQTKGAAAVGDDR